MKKKITLISILILLILIGILMNIKGLKVLAVDANNVQKAVESVGKIVDGYDPSNYEYYIYEGDFEATQTNGKELNPAYKDYQVFCAEKDNPADIKKYDLTKSAAEALEGTSFSGRGCKAKNLGKISRTFYEYDSTRDATPSEAYIISDDPQKKYSDEKQEALWGHNNKLYQEAKDYQDFDNQVRTDNGLNPQNTTKNELIYTKVNQDTNLYTVGPFNVTYTEGIYGGICFGGIHDMKIIGYNSEGNIVRDDITIEKFIIANKEEKPEYFEPKSPLFVDETKQIYPKSGEDFEVVFQDPNKGLDINDPNRIVSISIKVKFQYMMANGKCVYYKGYKYKVEAQPHDHDVHESDFYPHNTYIQCSGTYRLAKISKQPAQCLDAIRTLYEQEIVIGGEPTSEIPPEPPKPPKPSIDITMNLGGYVWEETLQGKESLADGKRTSSDKKIKNAKVTLYDETGKLVRIVPIKEDSDQDIMHHINSTLTDEEGYYQFNGLDAMRKYYVQFEYNGQTYLPTEYSKPQYNTTEWKESSKATELASDRNNFDGRFKEIGSYPKNYPSSNSLNISGLVEGYNTTFTQLELMGYVLQDNGKYEQVNTQLIDGFKYDENGLQTNTYEEGIISKKIREFINTNQSFPDATQMKNIYSQIANNNEETWKKLQFIEDCKIVSYTGNVMNQTTKDLYPYYTKFCVNSIKGAKGRGSELTYNENDVVIGGVTYKPIYSGQYFINLGLWRRQEFDMALKKDVYKAALKINNKTVVYNYDKRKVENGGTNNASGNDNNTSWDINVRMSDYNSYYGLSYNRELYETDYLFKTPGGIAEDHPGNPLEVFVTYKITVRNQSMSIMGQIKEVVDYYDKDYEYREDLSWVTYNNNTINEDQYYKAIETENLSAITNAKNIQSSNNSVYGKSTESDIVGNEYNAIYINGLSNKKLATGESAYIYLTFQVRKENGRVILDGGDYATSDTPKENLAEINGYLTYYKDGTKLPNGVTKNSNNPAGLIDRDSNPGNLVTADLQGDKYEKNFEDDTDRAPSLRIIIDNEAIRKANGTVWEDKRDNNVEGAMVGNGIRDDEEIGVNGITVQLIEKCTNGTEYIWKETSTANGGKYNFEEYIPGDYIVRFQYGNTEATALPSSNGGANVTSYNGQDFKSTLYQTGIKQDGKTDLDGRYQGYINTEKQNETGNYNSEKGKPKDDTFGYNIYASDSNPNNYSDAKDIWSIRNNVINYSKDNVTNHKAEVLASPYSKDESLYGELIDNTKMTAETGIIVVEFEYDRQQTDGIRDTVNNSSNSSQNYVGSDDEQEDNRRNSRYNLNNIDFGLVERPKAQLEIDKSVANVKVTLANGSILFDINEAANNALWKDHKEYSIDDNKDKNGMYNYYYGTDHRYAYRTEIDKIVKDTDRGLIQLTMDEELMHGATIQITYTIKVTNVGEIDYVDDATKDFYYKGNTSGISVVTTTANQLVDYVQNNLQFDASNKVNSQDRWSVIKVNDLTAHQEVNSDLVNKRWEEQLHKFNTIIQTDSLSENLVPGQEISKTLILSQLITPENEEDDLTYGNMVEIVKTSNTAGRRMAYSVVGNENPLAEEPSEVDTSIAEKVVILPPFGALRIIYIVGAVVAIILVAGIILIKKKVLNNKS